MEKTIKINKINEIINNKIIITNFNTKQLNTNKLNIKTFLNRPIKNIENGISSYNNFIIVIGKDGKINSKNKNEIEEKLTCMKKLTIELCDKIKNIMKNMKNMKNIKTLNDLFEKINDMNMKPNKKVELINFIKLKLKEISIYSIKVDLIFEEYNKYENIYENNNINLKNL